MVDSPQTLADVPLVPASSREAVSPVVPEPQARSTSPDMATSPSTAPPRLSFYHPELDVLRFGAFFMVFVFHFFPADIVRLQQVPPWVLEFDKWAGAVLRAGEAGVDLFFVLSSYLITSLLLREREACGQIALGAFYLRRCLRIWPLYFAFVTWAVLVEPSLLKNDGITSEYLPWFVTFLANWKLAPLVHLPATTAVVLWTVSIEEQFYLSWPIVMRWLSPRRMVAFAVALLVLACGVRAWLVPQATSYYLVNCNTFARLDGIALGALVALLFAQRLPDWSRLTRRVVTFAALGLLVVTMRYLRVEKTLAWGELLTYPLMALCMTALMLATLRPLGTARGLAQSRLLRYLGRISFGLYVFHLVWINVTNDWAFTNQKNMFFGFRFLLTLGLTIITAMFSYHLLEQPFLQLKERFAKVRSRPGG